MRLAFVTLLLGVHSLWAVDQKPLPLPFGISAYVPAGWKAVAFATGDLNADGRSDFVLVCDDLDYDHVEDGTDNWPYSENPTRAMYVFLRTLRGMSSKESITRFLTGITSVRYPSSAASSA
jgi:hypothetical protein